MMQDAVVNDWAALEVGDNAEVGCIPEHLDAMWARLRPVFAELDG